MSGFAQLVHSRISAASHAGTLAKNPTRSLAGPDGKQALAAGSRSLQHLTETNQACAADARCHKTWEVLGVAYEGSGADTRTALTQLQTLLRALTEEDSDVAGDDQVQTYRRHLHRLLDH
jgi:hypothetical protein